MFQHSDQHGDSIKNDVDDEILYVPKVMMNYPLGFVVDAGFQIVFQISFQ